MKNHIIILIACFILEGCCLEKKPDPVNLTPDETSLTPYQEGEILKFKGDTDTLTFVVNSVRWEESVNVPAKTKGRCDYDETVLGLNVSSQVSEIIYPQLEFLNFFVGRESNATIISFGANSSNIFNPDNSPKLNSFVVNGQTLSDVYLFAEDTIYHTNAFIKIRYIKKGEGLVRFDLNHSNKIYEKIF